MVNYHILSSIKIGKKLMEEVVRHTDILYTERFYHRNHRTVDEKQKIISSIPECRCLSTFWYTANDF